MAMADPAPSPDQPPAWLARAVAAIERGDWRFVLYPQEKAAAHGAAAVLLLIVRAVASSMRLQAFGAVPHAWRKLAEAALMLPRAVCPLRQNRGTPMAALAEPPPVTAALPMLTWRVARVIWREQQELLALQRLLRTKHWARDVLIAACVEYLLWVEWDPWTWNGPIIDENPPGMGRTAAEFCARATILRRFAIAAAPELSTQVWRRLGGYRGLHSASLRVLVEADLMPWKSEDALTVDVPVRCARVEAHGHAMRWHAAVS